MIFPKHNIFPAGKSKVAEKISTLMHIQKTMVKVSIRNVKAHMPRENLNDLGNSDVKENRYNLRKRKHS